jgi:hypothetical protein
LMIENGSAPKYFFNVKKAQLIQEKSYYNQ